MAANKFICTSKGFFVMKEVTYDPTTESKKEKLIFSSKLRGARVFNKFIIDTSE